jgi:hypothetical protein
MPAQLSTILYITNYKESISPNFLIGTANGVTRLNDNDSVQEFKITVFYPTDSSAPCYVPKIADKQILSVNDCKFSLGKDGEIDVNINKLYFYIFHSFQKKSTKLKFISFFFLH